MFDDVIFNHVADRTPPDITHRLLDQKFIADDTRNLLNPYAGAGCIVTQVRNRYPWLKVTAVEQNRCFAGELGKTGAEVIFEDFTVSDPVPIYDRIICRPHPNRVKNYIRHGFQCLKPDGQMAHLMSMQFISANAGFLREIKPSFVYSIPPRYDIGAELYAWVVWHRNPSIPITLFDWL